MNYSKDLNTIGGRLAVLFNSNESYNLDKRGGLNKAIKIMFKKGILKYRDLPKDSQESLIDLHIADETNAYNQIKKHLQGLGEPEPLWLKRYCKFFGCSSDYLLGIIDRPTHELTDIFLKTGLSDQAIEGLLTLKDFDNINIKNLNPNHQLTIILDKLLALDGGISFWRIIECFRTYLLSDYLIPCTHSKDGKPIFSDSEFDVCISHLEPKIKMYILTLLRSKDDINDYMNIGITPELLQTSSMLSLQNELTYIKKCLDQK